MFLISTGTPAQDFLLYITCQKLSLLCSPIYREKVDLRRARFRRKLVGQFPRGKAFFVESIGEIEGLELS
jgi:hypothetical protein